MSPVGGRRAPPRPGRSDEAEIAAEAFGERGPLCLRTNRARPPVEALADGLARERAHARGPRGSTRTASCSTAAILHGFRGWEEGWFAVQDQASAFVVASARCAAGRPGPRRLRRRPAGRRPTWRASVGESAARSSPPTFAPERAALVARTAARLGVGRAVVAQDATARRLGGDVRPGPGRCALLGDRLGPPAARAAVARRASERPRVASRASRWRSPPPPADRLRPGGRLVYSVCTFPRAETDAACDAHPCAIGPSWSRSAIDGPDGARRPGPPVAPPSRLRRHVRGGLPQA